MQTFVSSRITDIQTCYGFGLTEEARWWPEAVTSDHWVEALCRFVLSAFFSPLSQTLSQECIVLELNDGEKRLALQVHQTEDKQS